MQQQFLPDEVKDSRIWHPQNNAQMCIRDSLRGGGAVDNNQGNGSHDHQIQAFRPSAPATAVATVMITVRISVQVFFFVLELIGILF